jgi:Tfp pilus assembly protein PilN
MIEINLIPDVKQELIKARRVRAAVISGAIITTIAAVGLVAALAVYVFGVQTVRHALVDDTINKKGAELASVEDLSKMLTIQNQLTKIDALHDAKKINSRLFDVLAAIIPPSPDNIQVSSLVIDAAEGTVTLEGQATNGYRALEKFKKTVGLAHVRYSGEDDVQQDIALASEIATSNVSLGEDASGRQVLRFTMSFVYAPELFDATIQAPSIVLIDGGNVTDSYLGIPKSIFVDRAVDIEEDQ